MDSRLAQRNPMNAFSHVKTQRPESEQKFNPVDKAEAKLTKPKKDRERKPQC